jgi:hypothetical protein
MITSSPFAELTAFLSPRFMQIYIVLMIFAVAVGTIFDMFHKRSFEYFRLRRRSAEARAKRQVSGGERLSLMLKTLGKEVLTSGEFCNVQRRISHLLLFYGFLLYVVSTVVMVYGYPTPAAPTPAVWLVLWNLGAVMILVGGGWFFLFLRVNVAYEQDPPYRIIPADLFVGSLLLSALFALIWEMVQANGNPAATQIFFGIYLFFTTVLFVTVPWSKFAHMFYKPTAAYQRRIEEATETDNLPREARGRKQVASPTRTFSVRR